MLYNFIFFRFSNIKWNFNKFLFFSTKWIPKTDNIICRSSNYLILIYIKRYNIFLVRSFAFLYFQKISPLRNLWSCYKSYFSIKTTNCNPKFWRLFKNLKISYFIFNYDWVHCRVIIYQYTCFKTIYLN